MLDKPRDMIITLVSGGYHIDFRNKHGYTGIHRAAQKNNYEAVKVQMFVIYSKELVLNPHSITLVYSLQRYKIVRDYHLLLPSNSVHEQINYNKTFHMPTPD